MNDQFEMFSLTINAQDLVAPDGMTERALFTQMQPKAINLLNQDDVEIIHFGWAADNDADGLDELLIDGTLFRFNCSQEFFYIDLQDSPNAVVHDFLNIVQDYKPYLVTMTHELGDTKKEMVIEFLYQDLYCIQFLFV